MKKFLMVAALVAIVATPAFAGLAQKSQRVEAVQNYPDIETGDRTPTYLKNDPSHVYDNYQRSVGSPAVVVAPDDVRYSISNKNLTTGTFFGGLWNRLTLRPGTTDITQIHLRITTGFEGSTAGLPLQIGFFNTVSTYGLGTFLNTVGTNNAYFVASVPNPVGTPGVNNFTYNFPANVLAPASGSLWIGFYSPVKFNLRLGVGPYNPVNGFVGPVNQQNGLLGDAPGNPDALYIGSGSGVLGTDYNPTAMTGGGLITTVSSMANVPGWIGYTLTGSPSTATAYLNNFHLALGGTPEPTTALLLALGGLVALRRRKA